MNNPKEALEQALAIVNSAQKGKNLDAYLTLLAMLKAAIPVAELHQEIVELLIGLRKTNPGWGGLSEPPGPSTTTLAYDTTNRVARFSELINRAKALK